MQRRHALLLAVPTCVAVLWLACAPAYASRSDLIPAPPASASGVAAQVGSLLDISKTGATADSNTASSEASVIRITEHPLFGLGGSQQGDGQTGGALLDTQSSLPARVQVAPWAASASGSGTATRKGSSSAAVARADVPDIAKAGVLTSDSEATHTDAASSGRAITEGLHLGILDVLDLVLLHSEVDSSAKGHSYLVGLNGTELGTDDQLGASPLCALNAPGLLALSCLTASGGQGTGGTVADAAQVAQLTPAIDALNMINPVAAFTSTAASGTGQTAAAAPEAPLVQFAETSRAAAPAVTAGTAGAAGTGALPRTGAYVASLAASALAMLLLGLALRRFRLRPAAVVSK
jgi:hypothetical protein